MTVRLLFICHDGALYGSQRSLLVLAQHLPPEDYAVTVSIARFGPLNTVLEQTPTIKVRRHRRLAWFKHDKRNTLERLGDVLALSLALPFRVLPLVWAIKRQKIEIVHTNSVVSLEGALAARLAGVRHVWHIRELFWDENPKLFPVLGRRLTRSLIRLLSDRIICISQAVQKQFVHTAFTPQKYPVVYNALNGKSRRMYPGLGRKFDPANRFVIGYIGRLSEGKRFHDLLHALPLLLSTQPHARLLAVGDFVDDPYERYIAERIASLGLADRITFLPFQPDLTAVWAELDVFVLPSLNEPFGRILIEAMQAGVLCVAANAGGVPEIITDGTTGLLYPPKDLAALAMALDRVATRPLLMHDIRDHALRMVNERFTLENHLEAITACYQRLLNPPEKPSRQG